MDNNAKAVVSTENTLQHPQRRKKRPKRERGKYYHTTKNAVSGVKHNGSRRREMENIISIISESNGAAYAGTKACGTSVPQSKRSAGAYYGFDRLGHMLKGSSMWRINKIRWYFLPKTEK
ncbi:MAG: hypothetical protein ACLR6B_13830 [Blautia sp.]